LLALLEIFLSKVAQLSKKYDSFRFRLVDNILEMKFLQGRKVREVAQRLALSEANFYRKQRIALEEVVRVLLEMEAEARQEKHRQ